jgi:hypothetical protein
MCDARVNAGAGFYPSFILSCTMAGAWNDWAMKLKQAYLMTVAMILKN